MRNIFKRFSLLTVCSSLLLVGALTGACDSGDEGESDSHAESEGDGHEEELPEVDCEASTIPSFAEVTAVNSCLGCHSSELSGGDRSGAPAGIDYDTHPDAVTNAEHGVAEIFAGRMPIGATLSSEEKESFYIWALCGTPE